MKNYRVVLLVILLLGFNSQLCAQEKEEVKEIESISLGVGFPELFSAGLHQKVGNIKLGLGIGGGGEVFTLSPHINYYLNKDLEVLKKNYWYLRTGLSCVFFNGRYVYLDSRVGKETSLSDKVMVNVNIGVSIGQSDDFRSNFLLSPVMPSFGVTFIFNSKRTVL